MLKEKIQNSLLVLFLSFLFLSSFISFPSMERMERKETHLRGAETAESLSDAIYYAVKMNDFSQLNDYIPSDKEITHLQKTSSEKNKVFFDELEPVGIKERLQVGFDNIARNGIEKHINWSNVQLVDYKTRTCRIEFIGCNVTYTIQDQADNRLVVTYDAIKVKDRWFLFQGLSLSSENKTMSKR